MLIISKNEELIANLDNIYDISMLREGDGVHIYCNKNQGMTRDLGCYRDDERCKKILTEIINYYCTGKKVYYMPEE